GRRRFQVPCCDSRDDAGDHNRCEPCSFRLCCCVTTSRGRATGWVCKNLGQFVTDIANVTESLREIFFETTFNDAVDGRMQVRWKQVQIRCAFDNRCQNFRDILACKNGSSGQHFEEHATKRPDVGGTRCGAALCLFRRHVGCGAENHALHC